MLCRFGNQRYSPARAGETCATEFPQTSHNSKHYSSPDAYRPTQIPFHNAYKPRNHKCESPARRTCGAGETFFGLALAELEAFPSPGLPVLFAFTHTRIARHQTIRPQHGTQVRIGRDKRPRKSVPDSASLAIGTAAADVHANIVPAGHLRQNKRLRSMSSHALHRKIRFERPAIDGDFAIADRHANARDRCLAAAGSKKFRCFCHRSIET